MNVAAITVFSVLATALFGMSFVQLQGLRKDMREGFRTVNGELKALDRNVTGAFRSLDRNVTGQFNAPGERIDRVYGVLREHGESLAGIEAKPEIDPPPEAA